MTRVGRVVRTSTCPHCNQQFELCGVFVRDMQFWHWVRCDRPAGHDGLHGVGGERRTQYWPGDDP